MFIDHLRNGVAQQDNVLIEGLYLALKLDAIDQIDGYWNMFPAQGVEKWILQKLTFVAHDILRVQDVK